MLEVKCVRCCYLKIFLVEEEAATKNPRETSLDLFLEPDRTHFPKRIAKFSTNHVHLRFHRE